MCSAGRGQPANTWSARWTVEELRQARRSPEGAGVCTCPPLRPPSLPPPAGPYTAGHRLRPPSPGSGPRMHFMPETRKAPVTQRVPLGQEPRGVKRLQERQCPRGAAGGRGGRCRESEGWPEGPGSKAAPHRPELPAGPLQPPRSPTRRSVQTRAAQGRGAGAAGLLTPRSGSSDAAPTPAAPAS